MVMFKLPHNFKLHYMKQLLLFAFLNTYVIACNKEKASNPSPVVPPVTPPAALTFTNPLLASGPDPWVIKKDSIYYYTHTLGNRIALWRTTKMGNLKNAPSFTVWTAPSTGNYSHDIWAPELHYINSKWYIYFAADDGNNATHRLYVLENGDDNPLSANWVLKGKIADSTADKWAIDGSVFEQNGKLFMLWSGWQGDVDGRQDIYVAPMSNPWTISGSRVLISSPLYDWEKVGGPTYVNEAPEALTNAAGKLFITYSASGCWTDNYCLGLLTLKDGGNPLTAGDWTKTAAPVLSQSASSNAFGPGHNGFFKSVDGKEDWIIYHANSSSGQGCGDARNPRIQPFSWKADGTPDFGQPVKINTALPVPSGE